MPPRAHADVPGPIRRQLRSVEDADLLSAFAVPLNPAEGFHHGSAILAEERR